MSRFSAINTMILAVAVAVLAYGNSFATSAMLQNPGFETYIAATDSFAYWKADRDATGGTLFAISQETTDPVTGTGCLKMTIMPGADTLTECRISGAVTNLPPNKIFTVTAMVKYSGMPAYWNAMFNMQQATLTQGTWVWTDRKWLSMWGNDPGDAEWKSVTMSDTAADSANVFNLIISLSNSGTLWVDDIAITYTDIEPVTQKAVQPVRRESLVNNRITFSRAMPYTVEAVGVNGRVLVKRSGTASDVDLNRLVPTSGAYIVRVKSTAKTFIGRVVAGR